MPAEMSVELRVAEQPPRSPDRWRLWRARTKLEATRKFKNNGNVFTIALLSVCRCMRVTAKGHRALAEGCPAIRYLRLYGCKPVTDDSLAAFASLQHLQLLDLCGAEHVTDGGLQV